MEKLENLIVGTEVSYSVFPDGIRKPGVVALVDDKRVVVAQGEWAEHLEKEGVSLYCEEDQLHDLTLREKYLGCWSISNYEVGQVKELDLEWFVEERGYDKQTIDEIMEIKVGDYAHCDSGHIVVRVK